MIRIYPELLLKNNKRADIAIVKISPKRERVNKYLGDCIEEVLAIIELKYKSAEVTDAFHSDVTKLHEYSQAYPECQLYTGFIHEQYYNDENCSWFDGRQISKWANGRVSELLGYWDEANGNFTTKINSYNNMNIHMVDLK